MKRALEIRAAGNWNRGHRADGVVLDYERRCRRRQVVQTVDGASLLLDFARPPRLRHGDGLLLEDGGIVEVVAAPESLLEVTCASRLDLIRIAWHVGNRHFPAQLREDAVLIRADHVLADMVTGLGAAVRPIEAPFDPEGGAYDNRHGTAGPAAHHPHSHGAHSHGAHSHDGHGHHGSHGHHHEHGHGHGHGEHTHGHGDADGDA